MCVGNGVCMVESTKNKNKKICGMSQLFFFWLSGMSQLSRLNSCVRLNFAFGNLFGIHNYEN